MKEVIYKDEIYYCKCPSGVCSECKVSNFENCSGCNGKCDSCSLGERK